MKKHTKIKIRRLINLDEEDGLKKSVDRLLERREKLAAKQYRSFVSRHMKYIDRQLKRLGYMIFHNELTATGRIPTMPEMQRLPIAKGKSFK